MLLIITNSYDSHADGLEKYAKEKLRLPLLRLNSDKLDAPHALALRNNEIQIRINGTWIDNKTVQAIWFRKPSHWWLEFSDEYQSLNDQTKQIIQFKKSQTGSLLYSYFWQMHERKVPIIPNPLYAKTKYAKVNQLRVAERSGVNIPQSCLSSDKEMLSNFVKKFKGKVVIKSFAQSPQETGRLSPEISMTQELNVQGFDAYLKNTTLAYPVLLQRQINPKVDIRVTCVGGKLFAVKIVPVDEASQVDIRFTDDVRYKPITLPASLAAKIKKLNKEFGLVYAAYDFAYSPDEKKYYFLEVNPYGQYLFIEEATGAPITKSIADYFGKLLG